MKKFVIGLLACVVLSGCHPANPGASVTVRGLSSAMKAAEQEKGGDHAITAKQLNAGLEEKRHADSADSRLRAIKLKGQDGRNTFFIVTIGAGFTKAMVKDEPAKIAKQNENFYEITSKDYIIGVYLDDNGVVSSSWNRHKGRDHGQLFPIEGE